MKDGKRVILHVTFDNILFDTISSNFEKLDGYINIFLEIGFLEEVQFKFISHPELVTVAYSEEEWLSYFSKPEVDIIYFHGLWQVFFRCYNRIGKDKIVIWYCYGKEIYEIEPGYPCLMRQRLFKSRDFFFYYWSFIKRFHFIRSIVGYILPFYDLLRGKLDRRKLLKRIDYIQTPLMVEQNILRKLPYFNAKPFKMSGRGVAPKPERVVVHDEAGSILINHSAAYTNNVLGVMRALSKIDLHGRELIFPIVYGWDKVKDKVKEYDGLNGCKAVYIEDRLPLEEYENMMSKCTHAIYGTLRQQALGNIFGCFKTGVKVFLYKDSMNYKQFKKDGFVVFSIEEMDFEALSIPMSKTDALHNNELYYSLYDIPEDYLQTQFDSLFK